MIRTDGSDEGTERGAAAPLARPSPRVYSAFVALMVTGSLLGLLKGLVYAKVLDPQEFGYYGLVVIVLQFGVFLSNWGILSALNNHLPIAFGKGQDKDTELLERAMGALLVSSGLTAAVYLAVIALLDFDNRDVQVALALAAFTTIAATIVEFHMLVMRVQQGLIRLGLTYCLRAGLTILAGTAAAVEFGYRGLIVAEFCALLVTLFIARRYWLDAIGVRRPAWAETKRLVRAGWPLMVANSIVILAFVADRLFVAATLPDEFGQYALAALVVIAWVAVVSMLEQAVAPRLLREYGAGMTLRALRSEALKVAFAIAGAGLVGLAILLVVVGPLKRGFLSNMRMASKRCRSSTSADSHSSSPSQGSSYTRSGRASRWVWRRWRRQSASPAASCSFQPAIPRSTTSPGFSLPPRRLR